MVSRHETVEVTNKTVKVLTVLVLDVKFLNIIFRLREKNV